MYHNVLKNVHPKYFHCQPNGGGLLENHLFAGEEAILRTEDELEKGVEAGIYDEAQFKQLKERGKGSDYENQVTEQHKEKMAQYQALGLDPENNNYVGEKTYNLCEWILTHKGKRYYLLFDPWTATWLRGEVLKDIHPKNTYIWKSWATHEDDKVFWSISYADIIYPVADAVVTLYNQELTNREKRNLGARAYDKDMFPDVAKLDAAQYRPDALVPVDTKGGTRKIGEGLYRFDTAELQGTINLLDWTIKDLQTNTGVTDISQGSAIEATKKVSVAYMEQASVAKRIGYKSQSYTECWGEVGTGFYEGMQMHMTKPMQIEILGDMGIEPDVLTRDDLDLKAPLSIEVISSTAQKQESQKKKQGKIDALKLLMNSQNINSEMRDASILRYVGEFSEDEIKLFLDTKNYASKESVAKAHIAIQEMLTNRKPEINYAADAVFLKIIFEYMMDHRNKLGIEKGKVFTAYLAEHAQLAMDNGKRNGTMRGQRNARAQIQGGGAVRSAAGGNNPQPVAQGAEQMQ